MQLIKGENLTPKQVKEVKSAFVHRFTGDHLPTWANKPRPNGEAYKPEFKNDEEWLKSYAFYFRKDRHLSNNPKHCEYLFTHKKQG